ncbi:MAG TPA: hypothetical protein VHH88_03375 [Verrucomicrobiae bacterium]|nr:hypothetical protein [Verrucomicrobiae bacterium]
MDNRIKDNGLSTFAEHWGLLIVAVVALLASSALTFFTHLSGAAWVGLLCVAFVLMISGGALITYAKLPVYRSGRFFTFGIKSVPPRLQKLYIWGWRLFLFGVVVSLCLLLLR